MRKSFQELDLKDSFLFGAALQDEEICRLILEIILGEPVGRVKVRAEETLLFSSDYRSLRLDIYAGDEMQVGYNLEMQNEDEHNLPKRSRFHQAEMDATSLKPSEGFSELKPSYVIFICTFDPFSHGLYRYTFENRCLEKDFPLEDGTKKIFLNTRGKDPSGVPALLVHFLHYVENTTAALAAESGESKISVIHERVTGLKRSRRWEGRYMLLGEYIDREVKRGVREETEAMAERLTEEVTERVTEEVTEKVTEEVTERVTEEVTERVTGEVTEKVTKEITEAVTKEATETATQRLLTLIGKMLADGRAEEVSRLSGEPEFLEKIWKEYQL